MEQEHIEWTKNALGILKVGGTWTIPRSLVYVIKDEEKSVTIVSPKPISKEHEEYLNDEIKILRQHIEAAGYKVKEKIDDRPDPMSAMWREGN